jgi:hypothetical protein
MPAKTSHTESDGFSAQERAAMKERAAELRAEGKKGAKKADGCRRSSTASRRWRRRIGRSPSACT